MRLLAASGEASGDLRIKKLPDLEALRRYAQAASVGVVADIELEGGEPFAAESAAVALMKCCRRGPVLLVTHRLLPHLPWMARRSAKRMLKLGHGPVATQYYRVPGWRGQESPKGAAATQQRTALRAILAMKPEDLEATLPGSIIARVRDGTFGSLRDILVASPDDLEAAGVSALALDRLRSWFQNRTEEAGTPLTLDQARELLQDAEHDVQSVDAPAPARVGAGSSIPELLAALTPEDLHLKASRIPGLSTRVVHALRRHRVDRVQDLGRISEAEMLTWANFGLGSLANLRARILFLWRGGQGSPPSEESPPSTPLRPSQDASSPIAELAAGLPAVALDLDIGRLPDVAARVVNVLPSHGVWRIRDLLPLRDDQLAALPNFGDTSMANLRSGLRRLREQLSACSLDVLSDPKMLIDVLITNRPLLESVDLRLSALEGREARVAHARLFTNEDPLTLQQLAEELGVSRERVRQIELEIRRQIDPHGDTARIVDYRLRALRSHRSSPLRLQELAELDAWFAGCSVQSVRYQRVLEALACSHAVARWESHQAFVTLRSCVDLGALKRSFRTSLPPTVGADDLAAAASRFVSGLDVPELAASLLNAMGSFVEGDRGIVFEPRVVRHVEAVLAGAEGPLAVTEIEERLRKAAIPFARTAVRGSLDRLSVINTGPSEYILMTKLDPWLSYRDKVIGEVEPLLAADPSHQWSTSDILVALQDEGHDWATAMPAYVIEYLLRQVPTAFHRLGRGLWCSVKSPTLDRHMIVDVCCDVLRAAGGPLPLEELERQVRQRRSLRYTVAVLWPLVRLGNGTIGLGPRDLGLSDDAWRQMQAEVGRSLTREGRVSPEDLQALLRRHYPDGLNIRPEVLARAMRPSSQILIDGNGVGDGLRRSDLPRQGDDVKVLAGEQSLVPSVVDATGQHDARGAETEDLLGGLEGGCDLVAVSAAILRRTGRTYPPASLRVRLMMAGWTPDESGRWYPPQPT